jgi:hypothetical protein
MAAAWKLIRREAASKARSAVNGGSLSGMIHTKFS